MLTALFVIMLHITYKWKYVTICKYTNCSSQWDGNLKKFPRYVSRKKYLKRNYVLKCIEAHKYHRKTKFDILEIFLGRLIWRYSYQLMTFQIFEDINHLHKIIYIFFFNFEENGF